MFPLLISAAGIAGRVTGFLHIRRTGLTLLALAIAAATLWVLFNRVQVQRDKLEAWATLTCTAAGTTYIANPPDKHAGTACTARITALAAYERDTAKASAAALAAAMTEHNDKASTDAAQARADAADARDAVAQMETENAKVLAEHVDSRWFAALNRAGGLHPPRP